MRSSESLYALPVQIPILASIDPSFLLASCSVSASATVRKVRPVDPRVASAFRSYSSSALPFFFRASTTSLEGTQKDLFQAELVSRFWEDEWG